MPARLRDIRRALESRGVILEEPKSGSHWKATTAHVSFPIPAHNGIRTEIADSTLVRDLGARTLGGAGALQIPA